MKRLLAIAALVLGFLAVGCSSETKQEKMWDTSVAADSHIIDTGAVTDTDSSINTDSVNRDQSVKSDSVRQ